MLVVGIIWTFLCIPNYNGKTSNALSVSIISLGFYQFEEVNFCYYFTEFDISLIAFGLFVFCSKVHTKFTIGDS